MRRLLSTLTLCTLCLWAPAQNLATEYSEDWSGESVPEELIPFTVTQQYPGNNATGTASPQPYNDYVLFPQREGGKLVWKKTKRDISFEAPEALSKHITKYWDGGQVTVYGEEGELWFGGKKRKDEFSSIYRISVDPDGAQKKPERVNMICPEGGDCTDPFLFNSGKVLLFASNAPGGFGGWDIYMSRRMPSGGFTVPENLGPGVNTAGDERSPVVALLDLFFTASPREGGVGGWDIYMCPVTGDSLSKAQALPFPINTRYDEWSLSFGGGMQTRTETPMERTMWINSSRLLPDAAEGFRTFSLDAKMVIKGVVKTQFPEMYNDPKVTVTSVSGEQFEVPVNEEGRYYFWPGDPEKKYIIHCEADMYKGEYANGSAKSQPPTVTLKPKSLYKISLSVRVSGQGATEGAEVLLVSDQGDTLRHRTDRYGKAELVMMKPGVWDALVSYQGMTPYPLRFELKEGSTYSGNKSVYLQGRSGIYVMGKVKGVEKAGKLVYKEPEGEWKTVELMDGSYGFWTEKVGSFLFCATDAEQTAYHVEEFTTDIPGDTLDLDMDLEKLEMNKALCEFSYNPDPIQLQAGNYAELREILALMQTMSDLRVRIEAYSSTPGDARTNLRNSKEAAEFAADYLYLQGVSRGRVQSKGMGENSPQVNCGEDCSELDNARNRRIVIMKMD